MTIVRDTLRKVPVYSKQELFLYMLDQKAEQTLLIVTNAGLSYRGIVINMSEVKEEGIVLILQLLEPHNKNNILHISLCNIESVEFLENEHILTILSKGTYIQPKEYGESGKLQVKKALKHFKDIILKKSGVDVGIPEIDLPIDGKKLNRIIQLTQQLQEVFLSILQEKDAQESWKSSYQKLAFINDNQLDIVKNDITMEIHFPFINLAYPEIPTEEAKTKMMVVL
ncbi:hypothetical protein GCM10022393_25130 [Aquimarina addita]|uniref:Uncharacterized protein n=1 Tax=Aquimarina addita TaxID=870485 RepID=A0ABP6UL05_9FLAO